MHILQNLFLVFSRSQDLFLAEAYVSKKADMKKFRKIKASLKTIEIIL